MLHNSMVGECKNWMSGFLNIRGLFSEVLRRKYLTILNTCTSWYRWYDTYHPPKIGLTGRPVPATQIQIVSSTSLHYSLSALGGVLSCCTTSLGDLIENCIVAHEKVAYIHTLRSTKKLINIKIDVLSEEPLLSTYPPTSVFWASLYLPRFRFIPNNYSMVIVNFPLLFKTPSPLTTCVVEGQKIQLW